MEHYARHQHRMNHCVYSPQHYYAPVIAHFPFSEVQTQRERINDMFAPEDRRDQQPCGASTLPTVEIREIKPPPEIHHIDAASGSFRMENARPTVTEAVGYREGTDQES